MQIDSTVLIHDNAYQRHVHRSTYETRERIASALQATIDQEPFERVVTELSPAQRLLGRLRDCCKNPQIVQNETTGEVHVSESRCRSRICPRCGKVRTRQLRVKLEKLVALIDSPRMLTLTLASSNDPLSDQLARLQECFRRLRRRKKWKSKITGGLNVVEITWNHARHQWHPHIHALIDGDYWKQSEIADEWETVTGDSRIVDIRMIYGRQAAIGYVTKYVAKSQLSEHIPPDRIVEWAMNTHGARMVGTFGTLHGVKVKEDDDDADNSYEVLAPVNAILEASNRGEEEAQSIVDQLRIIKRRRLPNGEPIDDADFEQRCREAADSVRAWWAGRKELSSDRVTQKVKSGRPQHPPDQRSFGFGKERDNEAANESIIPGAVVR